MKNATIMFVLTFFAFNFSFGQEISRKDDVTQNVIRTISLKIDSLKNVYVLNKNEDILKEIDKQKTFLLYLDDSYEYKGNERFTNLPDEKIEKEIEFLKVKKNNLKESIHHINSQTKKYNFIITELKTKIKETDNNEEIKKIENQVLSYERKIFDLNCSSRINEIELMITSRDLTYLWNLIKH